MKIVIFSQMSDASTSEIMSWISYYKGEVIRINLDDPNFDVISIHSNYILLNTSFGIKQLLPSYFYWFRRAKLISTLCLDSSDIKTKQEDYFYSQEDIDALYAVYWWIIDKSKYIANPFTSKPCKLHALRMAKACGFLIPDTIFSSSKKDLLKLLKKHNKVAAKPFTSLILMGEGSCTKSFTNCIEKKDIKKISQRFGGMIFQNYIEKKYELRIFLFGNTLYSMAIFSQNDEKTKLDFRNYNDDRPNRYIPFKLSRKYSQRLIRLAKKMNIDSGSFDILVNTKDDYYFLEVNPIGQFGMVSNPCNYDIEKYIALYLLIHIEKNEERKKILFTLFGNGKAKNDETRWNFKK